jgi:hypothetical protein
MRYEIMDCQAQPKLQQIVVTNSDRYQWPLIDRPLERISLIDIFYFMSRGPLILAVTG